MKENSTERNIETLLNVLSTLSPAGTSSLNIKAYLEAGAKLENMGKANPVEILDIAKGILTNKPQSTTAPEELINSAAAFDKHLDEEDSAKDSNTRRFKFTAMPEGSWTHAVKIPQMSDRLRDFIIEASQSGISSEMDDDASVEDEIEQTNASLRENSGNYSRPPLDKLIKDLKETETALSDIGGLRVIFAHRNRPASDDDKSIG